MRFPDIGPRAVSTVVRAGRLLGWLAIIGVPQSANARAQQATAAPAFIVIVNAGNATDHVDRDVLSRIFLKRIANWPAGQPAGPLDLPTSNPAREAFSRLVHHKSVQAVRAYSQQQIFSGRDVPPTEAASEAEVLSAVKATPAAVGY